MHVNSVDFLMKNYYLDLIASGCIGIQGTTFLLAEMESLNNSLEITVN